MNVAVTVLGGLSTLLVLFRIIDPPSFGSFGGVSVDGTLEIGIFLGLITAAGIAYGGYRAMQEEGSTFSGTADKLSGGGSGAGSATALRVRGTPPPPPPAVRQSGGTPRLRPAPPPARPLGRRDRSKELA